MYYGQEQGFSGNSDPVSCTCWFIWCTLTPPQYNREAMWPSKYANTTTYQLVTKLNKVCYSLNLWALCWTSCQTVPQLLGQQHAMGNHPGAGAHDITVRHCNLEGGLRLNHDQYRISRKSMQTFIRIFDLFWFYYTLLLASKHQYSRVYPVFCKHVTHQVSSFSNLPRISELTSCCSILTCQQWPVGSNGTIDAQYSLGGVPLVLYPTVLLQGSGLCGTTATTTGLTKYESSAPPIHRPVISLLAVVSTLSLGFLTFFCNV